MPRTSSLPASDNRTRAKRLTGVPEQDVHLRSADFLDIENHPHLVFRSTRVDGAHKQAGDRFTVAGELTIRGTSMAVTLDATFEGLGTDPWGKQRAGFAARTEIDRREWGCDGIKRSKPAECWSRTA